METVIASYEYVKYFLQKLTTALCSIALSMYVKEFLHTCALLAIWDIHVAQMIVHVYHSIYMVYIE